HTRCLSDWSSDVCSSDLKKNFFVCIVRIEKNFKLLWNGFFSFVPVICRSAMFFSLPPSYTTISQAVCCCQTSNKREHTTILHSRSEERRVGKECKAQVTA